MLMIKIKTKLTIWDISQIFLALLIISINIREPFFHTREILFALTIMFSLPFMDIRKAKYTMMLMAIWTVTVFYNLLIPGSDINFSNGGFETIIMSAYLLLMTFYQKRYAKVIINAYMFVSMLVALIVISVWISCYLSDSIFHNLQSFFIDLQVTTGLSLFAIDRRMILGTRYLTVWYRTAPCMACALGYCLAQRLEGRKKNNIAIIILFIALIFTGTRANIISAMMLGSLYIVFKLYKKGCRLLPWILFSVVAIAAILFIVKFINDKDSLSSSIKVLDTLAYLDIFKRDPIRALFFGYGPGTSFYSWGRQKYVNVTENSLFETIRRYGLLSTCIIMFGIWFAPFKGINFKRQMNYIKYFYCCVFAAFMLSALSNPYLLDSFAFCTLLFFCIVFSYETNMKSNNY